MLLSVGDATALVIAIYQCLILTYYRQLKSYMKIKYNKTSLNASAQLDCFGISKHFSFKFSLDISEIA